MGNVGSSDSVYLTPNRKEFMNVMTEMRLEIWLIVAVIKKKIGNVIQSRKLPVEIWQQIEMKEV